MQDILIGALIAFIALAAVGGAFVGAEFIKWRQRRAAARASRHDADPEALRPAEQAT